MAKRCGLQFNPPAIVLIYEHKESEKIRKRIIPVRNFSKYSGKALYFQFVIVFLLMAVCGNMNLLADFN